MEFQDAFNVALTIAGSLAGFILKSIWESLKDLQMTDVNLAKKVGEMEVLVAGSYARREELFAMTKAIFDKLEKIDSKLDSKVDYNQCEHFHSKK